MPNRALVMSGGGSKGAFELGALDYLINVRNLDFQVIAGVSTGSLSAVMLAQGKGPEGLKEQVKRLKDYWLGIRSHRDIYRDRFLGKLLALAFRNSMFSSRPIWEKLQREVSAERLRVSGREFRVGAVSLESGRYRTISQRDSEIPAWVLASSSMPPALPPVGISGETWTDGGVRNVTPLEDAFRALKDLGPEEASSPDELYVLLASPLEIGEDREKWRSGVTIGFRTGMILDNEVYREDLDYALSVNQSVRFYTGTRAQLVRELGEDRANEILGDQFPFRPPKYRVVVIKTVVPPREYSGDLEFDPRKIREAFDGGQAAAHAPLNEEELLARLRGWKSRMA